ncbi:MAG: ChaN family lipoprotein [Planctomycetota bacterium]|nr:ABC transporter permease [Planctomycetota bacterium]MDP6956370.1 ChaN family lipoprotein [Planctomycetota bacterium]
MSPFHKTGVSLALLLCASCHALDSVVGPPQRVFDTRTGQERGMDELAADLASFDVVFLGEEHDNDVGHALQLEMVERLFAKRPHLAISLEMIERDVQGILDDYLAGRISEEAFLENSRPWPNYEEHYRPLVEFARRHGLAVIAGNIPRRLARAVAYDGLEAVAGLEFVPRHIDIDEPEYLGLFARAMGVHGPTDTNGLSNWFAAQCIKDAAMAESIADHVLLQGAYRPLVVHVCGRFHSDAELGTVSRLHGLLPGLKLAVISMDSSPWRGARPNGEERAWGRYIWRVRPQ